MKNNIAKTVKFKGFLCGLLATFLWGISGTCIQHLSQYYNVSASWMPGFRMLSAGCILLGFSVFRNGRRTFDIVRDPNGLRGVLLFAIFGLMLNQFCYFSAIQHSDAGTATVLQSLSTILVLLFTSLTARRMPKLLQILAVLLALAGVFLISTQAGEGLALSGSGLLWGLLAACSFASYLLLSRPVVNRWSSILVTGYGMLFGGIAFTLLMQSWRFWPSLDAFGIFLFFVVVIFGTVIPFSLFLQCVHDVGPVTGNLVGCFEPLFATVMTAVLLHTAFSGRDLAGFACILAAVILVQLS